MEATRSERHSDEKRGYWKLTRYAAIASQTGKSQAGRRSAIARGNYICGRPRNEVARILCVLCIPWCQLGQRKAEFAGGEGVEGAEAGGEFGGGQAAFAVEAAEKIVGGLFAFLDVAFHATGDQIAVGVGP